MFHYALRGHGFLVLGTSEGVGSTGNLFAIEDRGLKIFSKRPAAGRQLVTFSLGRVPDRGEAIPPGLPAKPVDSGSNQVEAQREFDRRLLASFSPPRFSSMTTLTSSTRAAISVATLKLAPGRATLNILKMAREGLLFDLRSAMNRSKKEKASVRKQKVQVRIGNGNGHGEAHAESHAQPVTRLVDFEVVPITIGNFKDLYFMIVFQDSPEPAVHAPRSARVERESDLNPRQLEKLQQELESTKEYLQSVIETQEATNEELQSANEEILSSNEELQSTNEELETAKEELSPPTKS